jgi:hypothetical protein
VIRLTIDWCSISDDFFGRNRHLLILIGKEIMIVLGKAHLPFLVVHYGLLPAIFIKEVALTWCTRLPSSSMIRMIPPSRIRR